MRKNTVFLFLMLAFLAATTTSCVTSKKVRYLRDMPVAGVPLNDRFEAVSMGLIAVNAKPFTRSNLLKHFVTAVSARDHVEPEAEWNGSMSFEPALPPSLTTGSSRSRRRSTRL